MSYMPHNFANGDIIEAGPINEMDQQIQTNETNIGAKLNKSDVYNGLDYTDEGKALDARQGKALSQAVGGKIDSTEKGAANGIAELGSDGKVPSSQLPSYVDDVLEFASSSVFPLTGESGKIYIALDTNKTYRWSGSTYAPVGNDLALGETSSTAYRGDRGKIAYNHATDNGRMTTAQASGLYKIATTEEGHVASVMAVAKSDITALGIPGQDTTYSDMTGATPSTAGTEGLVPAPSAGDQGKALFGDGTWKEVADPSDMTGATAQQGGAHGLVPAPAAGDQDKALFGDGTWKTVSVEDPDDFTGATDSTAGTHGLVPAPAAGDQTKVLTGDGTWKVSPGAKVYEKTVTITNTSGAYSQTFTDENISADMKAIELEVNRSYVFGDSIIVTPNDGSVTVACNDVAGTDTIKISLIKVIDDPTAVTSTEFTILNNRLLAVENVCTDTNIVIETTDWEQNSGVYEYTWESSIINSACSVEVMLRDGSESSGLESFEFEKVTGGVKFTADVLATGDLPLTIRIINAKADAFQELTASDIYTEAVTGADNVEEALTAIAEDISDNTQAITSNTQAIANINTQIASETKSFAFGTCYKFGKLVVLSFNNNGTSMTTSGYTLPYTAKYVTSAAARYYNGSSNDSGSVKVDDTKVYLYGSGGSLANGTYITGQIVYMTDD